MCVLAAIQRLVVHDLRFANLLNKRSFEISSEQVQIQHRFSYCTQRTYHNLCLSRQSALITQSGLGLAGMMSATKWQPLHFSFKKFSRSLSELWSNSNGNPNRDPGVAERQPPASDETLTVIAQHILEQTNDRDVRAASVQHKVVINMVKDLMNTGYSQLQVIELLSGRLWLLQEHDAVMSIVETLRMQGQPHHLTLAFVKNLPPEFCMQERSLADIPEIINTTMHQLRDLGFSDKNLSRLVQKSPRILLANSKNLRYTMSRLKGLFTRSDALKVAASCPVVFSQTWKETNETFDYAFFTMGYSQPQIVQSEVLACPLQKLQDRHIFLDRLGFFFKVKKKEDQRLNPNPPLKFIVNASDSNFASTYGDLSEEEYSTYLAMRDTEREEMNDTSDSNSDSDSSESEND